MEIISLVVLIYIFLITNNVEHLFMHFLAYGRDPGEEAGQVFEKRLFGELLQKSEWPCLPHAPSSHMDAIAGSAGVVGVVRWNIYLYIRTLTLLLECKSATI